MNTFSMGRFVADMPGLAGGRRCVLRPVAGPRRSRPGRTAAAPALAPAPSVRRTVRRRRLAFYGPAFVAAVAYVDPGNFATNFQAGARHGHLLVWAPVSACAVAMFIQYLSARTGLATGRDLPTLCRDSFRHPVVVGLWAQAEAGGHGHRPRGVRGCCHRPLPALPPSPSCPPR
ncbi:Nramp family divalent metal transporter [Streptomyces sp. NPDC002920]